MNFDRELLCVCYKYTLIFVNVYCLATSLGCALPTAPKSARIDSSNQSYIIIWPKMQLFFSFKCILVGN